MEYLLQLIRGLLGQERSADEAFAILVGLVAMLVIAAIGVIILSVTDPMRRRVQRISGKPATASTGLARLLSFGPRQKTSDLRTNLIHAGFESESGAASYLAIRVLLMVILPILVFAATSFLPNLPVEQVTVWAIIACGVGYLMPGIYLDYKKNQRMAELSFGFPDALDLLVACTEAGMGLNAALQRVGEQLIYSHPAIAHQFNLVNFEVRGGVDRMTALRNLADRTGLDGVRSLVGVLGQSIRYGTSVADTLRIFAEDLRDHRMQRAEEQAAKIGTKMIFPLIFCLFPSFFLVAIGPAIVGVFAAFK